MLLGWLYFLLGSTTLVAPSTSNVFTNSFLVRFHRSIDSSVAHEIAARNGFESIGEVSDQRHMLLDHLIPIYLPPICHKYNIIFECFSVTVPQPTRMGMVTDLLRLSEALFAPANLAHANCLDAKFEAVPFIDIDIINLHFPSYNIECD